MIIPKFPSIGVGVVTTSSLKSVSFWGFLFLSRLRICSLVFVHICGH